MTFYSDYLLQSTHTFNYLKVSNGHLHNNHNQSLHPQLSMGNNLPNCGTKRRHSERISLGDESPLDTEEFYNKEMPLQQFELTVSNIRLKNVPLKEATIILSIEDVYQKTLGARATVNGDARWEESLKPVLFKANAYYLRKYFLKVVVLDEAKILASQVRLNLFYVITGPIQQDFPIELLGSKSKSRNSRLRLEVILSQCVKFEIKPSIVQVTLANEHPGEAFHYSLKYVNETGKETQTFDSYNVENALLFSRSSDTEKEQTQKKNKNTIDVLDAQTHKLIWDQQRSMETYQMSLPHIDIEILTHDIEFSSFHFNLWRAARTLGDEIVGDEDELFAECEISFIKVSKYNASIEERNGIQYEVREVTILEKLWDQGREIGELKIECRVVVPRFYRQLTVCVRTEHGIQTNNPILEQEGLGHCAEIKELNRLKESVQSRAGVIRELKNNPKGFDPRILNERRSIIQELTQLVELLESTKSKVSIIYIYSSEQDLHKGQFALLNVANKLFYLLGDQEITISQLCWRGLIAFMMRGEFHLSYMGGNSNEAKTISSKKIGTDLEEKRVSLTLEYQTFLYKALDKVLQCLNREAIPESERTFAELFCACSYFKIPQFRNRLLRYIEKPQDPPLMKEYFAVKSEDTSILGTIFDWEENVYSSISHTERYKQNINDLVDILAEDSWRIRIEKRGGYFFYFIKYWVIYVDKMATLSHSVPWNEIHGYERIIRAFAGEMHRRKVSEYPDVMVEAATKLLSNELLLGFFIRILFNKTSLFDSEDILHSIEITSAFFERLKASGKRIPASFDYKFFFSAIEKMLAGTHCFVISRCIEMVYSNFALFSPSFKNEISLFLLGRPFFELFLNWSPIVRTNFFHFIVYKVCLSLEEGSSILTDEIYMRYRLIRTILTNAQKLKSDRQNVLLTTHFTQNYYKGMKRKLVDRRLKRIEDIHVMPSASTYEVQHLSKVPIHRSLSDAYNKLPALTLERRKNSYNPSDDQGEEELIALPQKGRKRRTSNESFALPEEIAPYLIEYIETALVEFTEIEEEMKLHAKLYIKKTKSIPVLKTRIPIDKGEIRPDTLDDW